MFLASLLNQDHYRLYNITLARKLGSIHAAILLCEFIGQRDYFQKQNSLTSHEKHGDGWFYYTIDKVEERTCLSRKNQDTEIKLLISLGLIESRCLGMPAKRHFRINDAKIIEYMGYRNGQTCLTETDKQGCMKDTNTVVQTRQTTHIYKDNKEDNDIPGKPTVKPSVDNAIAFRLASSLFKSIQSFKADFKEPKLELWAKDIDRMIRIDKRDPKEIEIIISWLPSHEFWKSQILSGGSLREKFDKLQMEREKQSSQDLIKTNAKLVALEKKENPEILKHIYMKGDYVFNKECPDKELFLGMNSQAFISAFYPFAGVELYE